MTEAELYAPDLDEGERDVETYPVPDAADIGIRAPYLRRVWNEAARLVESGEADGDGPDPE